MDGHHRGDGDHGGGVSGGRGMSMRVIISPAKKMNVDTDSLAWRDLPAFLPQTECILEKLRAMTAEELKKLAEK